MKGQDLDKQVQMVKENLLQEELLLKGQMVPWEEGDLELVHQ